MQEQSVADTIEFAKLYYKDTPSIHRRTLLQHAVAVAKMSEQIARKLYQDVREDFFGDDTQESVATIVHAALLHDVINVGRCAFEHIAERTTVKIATMVADLSRDYRLIETKRDMEYRGRLSCSLIGTQIIAVADILCSTKEIIDLVTDRGLEATQKARKILMQLDGDLLVIHSNNRFYTLRLYTHAAQNLLQDANKLIKDCRAQARKAKADQAAEARIRSRLAAKHAQSEVHTEKERSRGKKRAS